MTALGLSPEALERRRKYVMAGDAADILAGRWRKVWESKQPGHMDEDLSDILRVQMGLYTEPFNLFWCEKLTGRHIEYYSENQFMRSAWNQLVGHIVAKQDEFQRSAEYPFMACHLDGMTTTPQGHPCVIDAKHVGQAGEQAILNYTAAGTHQATVMGTDWWALSFFIGNGKHEVVYQEVDPLFQATLIAKERAFWGYVERCEQPPDFAEPTLAPKPQPKLRQINLDLTPQPERPNWSEDFIRLARKFAETDGAAKVNAIAREDIKKLVPEDVGLCQWGLIRFKRDGRGTSVVLEKGKDDEDQP